MMHIFMCRIFKIMKLTEQFAKAYTNESFKKQYENYEAVADNFTIEFCVWFDNLDVKEEYLEKSYSEMLEVFKQERGL